MINVGGDRYSAVSIDTTDIHRKIGTLDEASTIERSDLVSIIREIPQRGFSAKSKAFNIKGDGTDESTKVQAALDYIGGLGGGEISFPNGTYLFKNISVPSNIKISAAKKAIFKVPNGANTPMFVVDSKSDVEFDSLTIDGNGIENGQIPITSAVILVSQSKRVKVHRVEIRKPATSGVRFNSSSYCQVSDSYFSGQYDDESTSEIRANKGNEMALIYSDGSNYMVVRHNKVLNGGTNGIKFRATSPEYSKHNIIEGNTVKGNYFIGLANGRIAYTEINNNNCSYNGDNGIDVNGSYNVTISGNNCCYNGRENHDNNSNGTNPEGDGIYYGENGCKNITVTGNVCAYNTRAGIGNVADSDYAVISSNILYRNDIGMQHANGLYWNISDNLMMDNTTAGLYIFTLQPNGSDAIISRGIIANNFLKDTLGTGVGVKLSNGGKGIFTDNLLINNFGIDWTTQAFASTTGTRMTGGESGRYSGVTSMSTRTDLKWNISVYRKVTLSAGATSITVNLGADVGRNNYFVMVTPSYSTSFHIPPETITNTSFVIQLGTAAPDINQFLFVQVVG